MQFAYPLLYILQNTKVTQWQMKTVLWSEKRDDTLNHPTLIQKHHNILTKIYMNKTGTFQYLLQMGFFPTQSITAAEITVTDIVKEKVLGGRTFLLKCALPAPHWSALFTATQVLDSCAVSLQQCFLPPALCMNLTAPAYQSLFLPAFDLWFCYIARLLSVKWIQKPPFSSG